MCNGCWNIKTFEAKKRNNENCDGQTMMIMSLDELKQNLTNEWLATNETHFDVFKQAVPNVTKNELDFEISAMKDGIHHKAHLHVRLI